MISLRICQNGSLDNRSQLSQKMHLPRWRKNKHSWSYSSWSINIRAWTQFWCPLVFFQQIRLLEAEQAFARLLMKRVEELPGPCSPWVSFLDAMAVYILHTHTHTHTAKEQNLTVSSELTQGRADIEKSLLIGIVHLGRFHKGGGVCVGLWGWAEMGSHEEQFKQYSGRSYLYLGIGTLANKVRVRDSYS